MMEFARAAIADSSASRVTAGAFEGLFRQHFLMCPFAWRDRIFWIDTEIWPAACVDTDPTSCAQRLAFTGKQKTVTYTGMIAGEGNGHKRLHADAMIGANAKTQ